MPGLNERTPLKNNLMTRCTSLSEVEPKHRRKKVQVKGWGEVEEDSDIQAVVLQGLPAGVCAINDSNIIVFASPAFERMFGYEPGLLRGQPISILADYTTDHQVGIEAEAHAALKKQGFWAGEFHSLRKDGAKFISSVRISCKTHAGENIRVILQTDISANKRAEALRLQLWQKLDAAREAERRSLARELHDQTGQDITALMLGLQSLRKSCHHNPDVTAQLDQLQEIVRQLGEQVHNFALELRPVILDDLGLQVALLTLFERWSVHSGIEVIFHCNGSDSRLPTEIETTLYRVMQEALTNVSKHAQAHKVEITLKRNTKEVIAIVSDNGSGFDVAAARSTRAHKLGLLGMRERVELVGGRLEIESISNLGTTIKIRIPLPHTKE